MAVKTNVKTEHVDEAIPPPRTVPLKPNPEQEKKRGDAIKSITEYRRAIAWEIHRWPLSKHIVEDRTRVHLPRGYIGRNGEDVRNVWDGTDLNQFVHNHYMELVDVTTLPESEANFVSEGNILARKHEFLGPDPRIVGYHYDVDGEIHIKWWDRFLQEQWMDDQKWKFEIVLNEEGQWTAKDLH